MARQPAHIVARLSVRMPYGQEGIWKVIRELRAFTAGDIAARVAADPATIRGYLRRLHLAGLIRRADCGGYTLESDQPAAPRLRADGSPAAETGCGQDHMWRAMKMLDSFDAVDLAQVSSTDTVLVTAAAAASYIGHLYRAGYLTLLCPAVPGSGRGRKAVYSLDRRMNTGPQAPQVQRTDWIWDPNTRRAHAPRISKEEA